LNPIFFAVLFAFGFAASASAATTFTLQILPGERADENIAWHDVNGDGRKDLIRQADRRLEVYLMGEHHQLSRAPDWRVQIAPPWDLWDFADVRADLPGEELLALSPQGVGWLSYQRHTTSTAQMEMLVTATLPITADNLLARPGHFVVPLAKDRPPDMLLPGRSAMRVFRRQPQGGRWEATEEIPAPLRPWPWFQAVSSEPYLVGLDRLPLASGARALGAVEPGRLAWREFRFRSSWSASGGWLIDWNGDGRLDWAGSGAGSPGGLRICLQTPDGQFDREHPIVPLWPAPLVREDQTPSDRRRLQQRPASDPGAGWWSGLGGVEFENLADLNGDGRLDVVRISALDNWASPKTTVRVYLQKPDASFPAQPDSTLRAGAILPTDTLPLADLDGDGALDLLLLRVDLQVASLHSQLKAFVRKGLETYLGAYLWKQGSGFARRPAWEKKIMIGHDLIEFSRDPQPLMVFDRDFTGDKRPDLVVRLTRDTVGIFPLTDPKKGFAETPMAVLKVPFIIERLVCGDFDGDGQNDVLIEGWDPQNRNRTPRAVFFGENSQSEIQNPQSAIRNPKSKGGP
jgi:hypothetical protein